MFQNLLSKFFLIKIIKKKYGIVSTNCDDQILNHEETGSTYQMYTLVVLDEDIRFLNNSL